VLAVVAIALSAGPVAWTAPVTLVRTSAPIEAFAHDAPVIGWISGGCRGVHLQNLLTSSSARIGRATIAACDPTIPPHLAVAGQRALWTQTPVGNFVYVNVMVGSLSSGRSWRVEESVEDTHEFAGFAVAGEGTTLAYSLRRVESVGPCPEPCPYVNSGIGVRRVEGRSPVQVSGAPTAVVLASASGRIALAPINTVPGERPIEPSNGIVELRRADSGELLKTIATTGRVRAVALSRRTLACIVETPTQKRIAWYSVGSGDLLGSLWVRTDVANELDISAGRIVFHRDRRIRLLDTRHHTVQLLTRERSEPVGLSIEGRRITWAVNAGGRGRVRTILLAR
jgi:hypothetical protein